MLTNGQYVHPVDGRPIGARCSPRPFIDPLRRVRRQIPARVHKAVGNVGNLLIVDVLDPVVVVRNLVAEEFLARRLRKHISYLRSVLSKVISETDTGRSLTI